MPKTYSHNYTQEKLASESRQNVETIRKNAFRLGAVDLVEMCDLDLASRIPPKNKIRKQIHPKHSETDVVTGYHFVCERDRGVTQTGDGNFWSGSWVVAETNVKSSLKYGAYLALHESKSEASYRQGQILDYRHSPRDMLPDETGVAVKTEEGIEFLVKETNEPYAWVGGGAGEKGYRWTRIASDQDSESDEAEVTTP
jgi:hypothetical protein